MPRALLACISMLVLPCFPSFAALHNSDLRFDRLSVEQGLSQVTVNCILQDQSGFMWFGTENGLNRYDGYTFTVYKHTPENHLGLEGEEDADGIR